jgi:hypothetical protein
VKLGFHSYDRGSGATVLPQRLAAALSIATPSGTPPTCRNEAVAAAVRKGPALRRDVVVKPGKLGQSNEAQFFWVYTNAGGRYTPPPGTYTPSVPGSAPRSDVLILVFMLSTSRAAAAAAV